jgi:ribosome maturation factor RimP
MSPILLLIMITREKIEELVHQKLKENQFLVDVHVSPTKAIHVEVDSMQGVTIDDCVAISRHIESHLDREEEDFELQVSSPGIDQYFKVNQQFPRNLGRELEVVTHAGGEYRGPLVEASDSGIILEVSSREKMEGERKKQLVTRRLPFAYDDIKRARVVISFK